MGRVNPAVPRISAGVFALWAGMSWPFPSERLNELEWRLRYGAPNRGDLLVAASVIGAFQALIAQPQSIRNNVVRVLRLASEAQAAKERT